jgi:4-hydroxybenzoate polyprenyltransferase
LADHPPQDTVSAGARSGARPMPRAVLALLRPKQWTKNLLVFAAPVFARAIFDPGVLGQASLGFLAFCLVSSSVYVVNDLLDVERDRLHPRKRRRPIASGEVGPRAAIALAAGLTVAGLLVAYGLGAPFCVAIVTYAVMSHFYSAVGKNVVILDTMMIAAGFVLRAVGGALAVGVPYSDWFVLFTLFGALFVALSKRRAELLALASSAPDHRPVLGRYTPETLAAFTSTSMASVLITYALYVVENPHDVQGLVLTVPFLVFGVFRYHYLVESEGLGDRPEEVFLVDRTLQVCVAGFAVVALVALYLPR